MLDARRSSGRSSGAIDSNWPAGVRPGYEATSSYFAQGRFEGATGRVDEANDQVCQLEELSGSMPIAALTVALLAAQCVPARWFSGEPRSLDLLQGSSVNCLVVDRAHWTQSLVREGHKRGIKILALVDSGSSVAIDGRDGTVVPARDAAPATQDASRIYLSTRDHIRDHGIVALDQGVWPGLRVDEEAIATPSSAPWVDTNLGYLRYLRSQTRAAIWLFNRPPAHSYPIRRYKQVLADAALAGAHWVIDVDDAMAKRLLARDTAALKDWRELLQFADFQHKMPDVVGMKSYSHLGVSVAPETGAFVSGGVLDMIGAQHIPFQVVQQGSGMEQFFDFPDNSVVKFPKTSLGRISVLPKDVDELEPLYRRVEVIVDRTNYGLRVFNGAGLLSAPYELPNGKGVVVEIANHTDFAADTITLHVRGMWKKATMDVPGQPPSILSTYLVKTATAVEIKSLDIFGIVKIE